MITFHEDLSLFQEAVSLTVAETAFSARLIEKDYFCSVLLEDLTSQEERQLVFKGGTCLAKVHADFYRMSEDLDFAIPMTVNSSRSERRHQVTELKEAFQELPRRLSCFHILEPLEGANNSTQYFGNVGYLSLLDSQLNNISIEISLREPLLTEPMVGKARTILLDPVSGNRVISPVAVKSLSKHEATAEKFRAALTRREAAIRDFYDLDYLARKHGLKPEDEGLIKLVKKKLKVPGNEPIDIGENRLKHLRSQLDARLKPVLREKDFSEFDLDRAFEMVTRMAKYSLEQPREQKFRKI